MNFSIEELKNKNPQCRTKLSGWVDTIRNKGKIAFIILRDSSGSIQLVLNLNLPNLQINFPHVTLESVITVVGELQQKKLREGEAPELEFLVSELYLDNIAKPLPFVIKDKDINAAEDLKLKYRYLEFRSKEVLDLLKARQNLMQKVRKYFEERNFLEIDTPNLVKSTPEGARDYLVPSRIHKGQFYALPQSPQLYKQLMMIGGINKYFQICKCFRDEAGRGDRQPEFTQIDFEMAFANQEDIKGLVYYLIHSICPEGIQKEISYKYAMDFYNSDKPDIRKEGEKFSFLWVHSFPLFQWNEKENKFESEHHPFTMPKDLDAFKAAYESKNKEEILALKSTSYDLVLNGQEIGSGSQRIHIPEIQRQVFEILGLSESQIDEKFGFLLEAYEYGAPFHSGMAIGFDRLLAILEDRKSIKDVIPFPKSTNANSLMDNCPSFVEPKQLEDLGIQIQELIL